MKKIIFPALSFSLLLSGCASMGEAPAYYESGSAPVYGQQPQKNYTYNPSAPQTEDQRGGNPASAGKAVPQREVTATTLADPVSTAVPPPKRAVRNAETGSGPAVPGMAPTLE